MIWWENSTWRKSKYLIGDCDETLLVNFDIGKTSVQIRLKCISLLDAKKNKQTLGYFSEVTCERNQLQKIITKLSFTRHRVGFTREFF